MESECQAFKRLPSAEFEEWARSQTSQTFDSAYRSTLYSRYRRDKLVNREVCFIFHSGTQSDREEV